jgi:hypothetical protein
MDGTIVPNNRYSGHRDTEALKIPPKSVFSSEYRERKNLRVAAYCRVSTDRKEQATSYEIQVAHYQTYIAEQKDWILSGIYADEGMTATNTKHRTGFRRMLADARAGKFDMLITKSVSRYARNLMDGIQTARELLHLPTPVGILFEEEGLNTFRQDSEFILSIMLMIAQGESEKKSAAVKKAFQWRCDAQEYLVQERTHARSPDCDASRLPVPANVLLGYTKKDGKNMIIEPEGEKNVLTI